jgi:nucleoside phosphorylase
MTQADPASTIAAITFGVVTALPKEYAAMTAMLDHAEDYVGPRNRIYCVGEIPAKGGGAHRVAVVLADQGTAAASVHATLLSEDFPEVDAILMVGIAGGVPDVNKADRHVRLGDIVVSGEGGVVAYDFGKEHAERWEPRHPPRPPDALLYRACKLLAVAALQGKRTWHAHLARLGDLPDMARPPPESDTLVDSNNDTLVLQHPADPSRREGEPRVFVGTIACANRLLKNPLHRDRLRDLFDVRAVEMEGFGIAEATWSQRLGYLVVRGVCDYCDGKKGDRWQAYAAGVAAAYTRAVLEAMPASNPGQSAVSRQVRAATVPEERLRDLAKSLLRASTPPSLVPLFDNISSDAQSALTELERMQRTLSQSDGKESRLAQLAPLVNENLHQIISAPPGGGKTHMLWHGATELLHSGGLIPLYLPVGAFESWQQLLSGLSQAADYDAKEVLQDERICLILDGWSEFGGSNGSKERALAMMSLTRTRVLAGSRPQRGLVPQFKEWHLDPLPSSAVLRLTKRALPNSPSLSASMGDLLRLPLALCLYILLGGKANSHGELLSAFHDHLSRDLPERFRSVLAGSVAALNLSQENRSQAAFEEGLRRRAERTGLTDPIGCLRRLGTIEMRGGAVAPIHDLYWSWLSGIGLLAEEPVLPCVRNLSTRESLGLALESGARPTPSLVGALLGLDTVLAAQLAGTLDSSHSDHVRREILTMFDDPRRPVRHRAALAALRLRDGRLLTKALAIMGAHGTLGVYDPEFDQVLDLDTLFEYRGELAEGLAGAAAERILEAIADRGDEKWSPWLEQIVCSGKVAAPVGVAAALACVGRIPAWAGPHLAGLLNSETWRLRAVAARGANRELAFWIAQRYEEYVVPLSGKFVDLNRVLVGCGDDETFGLILGRFDSLPPKAQELISFAVQDKGDPWLGRFQGLAFARGVTGPHHRLLQETSREVSDSVARQWINNGPTHLGWRVLIERHGNAVVPELVANLPASFENLHDIPALEAMRYLRDPPDELADQLWARTKGRMEPRATADLLYALAPIRNRGVPSVVAVLARQPDFLPSYHLVLFLGLLKEWQRTTGLAFRIQHSSGERSFIDWIVRQRLQKNPDDPFFKTDLRAIGDILMPTLLDTFSENEEPNTKLIVAIGALRSFDKRVLEQLLKTPDHAKAIPTLFADALAEFPEEWLLRILDAPTVDFEQLVRSVAKTSSPLHVRFHAELLRRAMARTFSIFECRNMAQVLRVHPRSTLLSLLKAGIDGSEHSMWLVGEVERAASQLLVAEDGRWLD